jgi:hypothetical protein
VECNHQSSTDIDVFATQVRHYRYSQAHSELWPQEDDIILGPRAQLPGLYVGYLGLVVQAMRSGRIRLEQNHTGRKMCQYQGHVRFGLFHFGLLCLPRCILRCVPDSIHYAPQHATQEPHPGLDRAGPQYPGLHPHHLQTNNLWGNFCSTG